MAERVEGNDSDAPEEFTSEQGLQQDAELRKVQRESKARVVREGKQRRRGWAQKKTPKHTRSHENIRDDVETERNQESLDNGGMLPNEIVKLLASREKQVFVSDSEEENTVKKITSKRKMPKSFGIEPIILKDMPPAQCLQNSLEFLKKRKMLVSRSSSVLNNSNQALRLLSTSGVLSNK